MNASPVSATVLLLKIVNVSVLGALVLTGLGPNDFVIDGGTATTSVALLLLGPAEPVWVELAPPEVLVKLPDAVEVTLTLSVHEALAPMLPPVNPTTLLPAMLPVIAPPHVVVAAGVAATINPAGKLSDRPTLLKAMAFELDTVKVSVLVPLAGMLVGENAFVTVGLVNTVNVALAVLPVPALVDETVLVVLT